MADAPKPPPKPEAKYEPPKELPQAAAVQKFQGRPKRQPVEQAEYFYTVKGTHIAFFLSSLGMLISFIMMFHKDVDRPWKPYQTQFAEMDFEKLFYDMNELELEERKIQPKIDAIDAKLSMFYGKFVDKEGMEMAVGTFGPPPPPVKDLDKRLSFGYDKVHVVVDPETASKKLHEKKPFVKEKEKIRGELYARTQAMNFAKDEQGAARFRYEYYKHHLEEAVKTGSDRKGFYEHEFEKEEKEYTRVQELVAEKKAQCDELQQWDEFYEEFATSLEVKPPAVIWNQKIPDALKKERVAYVKELETARTRFEKEKPSFANTVRNAPGADFFAPTLKVKQHILLDLKDELNFAKVTKVDRCDTCHVSIGNPTYEVRINKDAGYDDENRVTFKNEFLQKFVAHARGKVEPEKCDVCKGHVSKELKAPLTPHKTWTSDDAIKFTKVFMAHPRLDLFVSDSSKHPIDRIGCTICHEGDGRDTDFTRVVHIPNTTKQGQDWRRRHGTPYGEELYNWNYRELWDLPMFPSKYVQASCRRCHTEAVELDGGEKYVEGMKLVERVGCYGCHRIDTYQILAKDLQNPEINVNRKNRRPGPPLLRIATKVTPEWASKWVLAPREFRPTTRMPHFFGQSNCRETVSGHSYPVEMKGGVRRSPVDDTIVASIVKYVFSLSDKAADPAPPALKGDPIKGEIIVKSVGCFSCHKLVETPLAEFQDAEGRPSKRSRFLEEFAPTLIGVGSKMNKAWLYAWVRNPKLHFRDSNMPNLRLSEQEATDVVEFLMTLKKPDWEKLAPPQIDRAIVDDLIREFLRKSMSDYDVEQLVTGKKKDDKDFDELATPEGKVLWLGRKMVKNFGCYSCHQLETEVKIDSRKKEGEEGYRTVLFDWQAEEGIGVELSGSQPWGSKHHDKLDFGFTENDGVNHHGVTFRHGFTGDEKKIEVEPTRQDWLEHKLANPRVFDAGKMASKPWDELLRMPNFGLNEREVESIATFVQSFTDHAVTGLVENAKMRPTPEDMAKYRGDRIVRENNCRACHRLSLDKLVVEWTRRDRAKNKEVTTPVEVEGRFGREESADDTERNLRKWKLLGEKEDLKTSGKKLYTFSWASDHRTLAMPGAVNPESKFVYFDGYDRYYLDVQGGEIKSKRPVLRYVPQEGGENIAELRKFKRDLSEGNKPYAGKEYEPYTDFMDVGNESEFESRSAPMLRSQGVKTQTEWLFKFLKAPYPIRPTLQPIYPGMKALPDVNLRMPTFDFPDEEANSLVRWFAGRDQIPGVDSFPSTEFPERHDDFLAARKAALENAGKVVKDNSTGCASCHYFAGSAPAGAVLKHAPDLARVEERLRPRWMYEWQADPAAIYPGTTMTQYDFKPLFGGNQKDGVRAAVEYLLNFGKLNPKK
jgi:cbb3-type cytochrome oxidase cytochrome c subunit/cytochrome c551/c552